MARTPAQLGSGTRISDHVTLGVLTATIPGPLIDTVLGETGRQRRRHRQLPARLVVYYVIALALYAQASYGEVLRCLLEGVRWLRLAGTGPAGSCRGVIAPGASLRGAHSHRRSSRDARAPGPADCSGSAEVEAAIEQAFRTAPPRPILAGASPVLASERPASHRLLQRQWFEPTCLPPVGGSRANDLTPQKRPQSGQTLSQQYCG